MAFESLTKAAVPYDPKEHPRWPKGTPGIGGRWMPKGLGPEAGGLLTDSIEAVSSSVLPATYKAQINRSIQDEVNHLNRTQAKHTPISREQMANVIRSHFPQYQDAAHRGHGKIEPKSPEALNHIGELTARDLNPDAYDSMGRELPTPKPTPGGGGLQAMVNHKGRWRKIGPTYPAGHDSEEILASAERVARANGMNPHLIRVHPVKRRPTSMSSAINSSSIRQSQKDLGSYLDQVGNDYQETANNSGYRMTDSPTADDYHEMAQRVRGEDSTGPMKDYSDVDFAAYLRRVANDHASSGKEATAKDYRDVARILVRRSAAARSRGISSSVKVSPGGWMKINIRPEKRYQRGVDATVSKKVFTYRASPMDRILGGVGPSNLADGQKVRLVKLHGAPKPGTMGQYHVADPDTGKLLGMVSGGSLTTKGRFEVSSSIRQNDGPSGEDILRHTLKSGGLTYRLSTNSQPNTGYAFSPNKGTEVKIPVGKITPRDIERYVEANRDALRKRGAHLGTWVHEGNVYLDVSHVGPSDESTIKLAREAKQKAVFDLSSGEEIPTGYKEASPISNLIRGTLARPPGSTPSETDTQDGLAKYIRRLQKKVRSGGTGMDRIALDNAIGAYTVRYGPWVR